MGSQCNIPLDVLTEEEARTLFNKCGGLSDDSSPLTVVAKSIANECKGLPLAIVTVASALKGKSPSEWEVALKRLRGSRYVGVPDADQDVYKCIRFSYDYLQNKEARLCFLLCSLFPEDHDIEVEVLVRYVYGLGLCQDVVDSIDSVRIELHTVITSLKASSLLLSGGGEYFGKESNAFVKMHDIVRDVAVWISSEDEKNASIIRAGMGLEEWPKNIHYQLPSRIFLMNNKIAQHCRGLVCPRLNLLLLDENGCYEFPDDFYDGMKELQVLSVCDSHSRTPGSSPFVSLPQSIQQLTNLCTLSIEGLQLNDISVLGKLKSLEILSLRDCFLEEFPNTIGELNGLRVLDLSYCNSNMRIPDKLLRKLSKLEELYIEISSGEEGSCYAILCDLMSLPKLSLLYLKTDNIQCLREDICFPRHLKRYYIRIGPERYNLGIFGPERYNFAESFPQESLYPTSKELILEKMDVAKLNAFKEIIPGVNTLWLYDIDDDCIPNIMPTIDQSGLHELTSLNLRHCHNMKCLIDTTDPDCKKEKELFEPDLVRTDVKENELLLSHLERLDLFDLPQLTRIWKGPTIEVVSLVKLTELVVYRCPKLTSLLSFSLARCLVQLQVLKISECNELKQVFYADERQAIGQESTLWFPQLRELLLGKLPKFISFWHENYIPTLPLLPCLEELRVEECPNMGTQFVTALRIFEKKLEVLEVEGPNWSRTVVEQLMKGSRTSLQQLSITNVEGLQPFITGLVRVKRKLTIRDCKGVEEILEVGGEHSLQLTISWSSLTLEKLDDLSCIWRGPSQILIFHNISYLSVTACHGLKKHLLTTSIARSLLQLCFLRVSDCKELEQIFGDDENDKTNDIVTLPRLELLRLSQLPNLISFCPSTYHFIFPSFSGVLHVEKCPNNRTGFFQETDAKRRTTTVHAKGEAHCSTQNRGKCNDITGAMSLPLYKQDTMAETSDECLQRGSNNA